MIPEVRGGMGSEGPGGALWKVADVAAYLRIHPKDVYELAALHGLPCIRFGRRLRFDPGDVLRWLSARKES